MKVDTEAQLDNGVEAEIPQSSAPDLIVHVGGPPPSRRELVREITDVLAALPLFAVAPLLRRWHQRWGATDTEVAGPMPGDGLVPGCQYVITRAISIGAPPAAVWPWLLQIGFGKAGFYSNDLLDNAGHPSAGRIMPEYQDLHVGDWVPMFTRVNERTAFKVASLESPRSLLWVKPDSTWAWQLTPASNGTRLVTRLRILYRWHMPSDAIISLFLNEFGDFPMMRKMLKTIKQRAEAASYINS